MRMASRFGLKDYVWEIFAIAMANRTDAGTAQDMFVRNLQLRKEEYKGASLDYATMGKKWASLSYRDRYIEKSVCRGIIMYNFEKLRKLWMEKNKSAFSAAVSSSV